MRAVPVFVSALAILVSTMAIGAQAPANFAGKWTQVPDPNAAIGMGGLGQAATIVQNANTLTVTRTTPAGEVTAVYKLDGSESKNSFSMQGNTIEMVSKTKWEGSTLHINTAMDMGGTPVELAVKMWLDPSGALLVESTRPDFQGGGGPITTKMTYKKQ